MPSKSYVCQYCDRDCVTSFGLSGHERACYKKNHARKKRIELLKTIDETAVKRNISIKCQSDKILLYYRYIIEKLIDNADPFDLRLKDAAVLDHDIQRSILKRKLDQKCFDIYSKIRGDIELSGRQPSSIATAIVYIGAVMLNECFISQDQIAEVLKLNKTSLRKTYKFLKYLLRL